MTKSVNKILMLHIISGGLSNRLGQKSKKRRGALELFDLSFITLYGKIWETDNGFMSEEIIFSMAKFWSNNKCSPMNAFVKKNTSLSLLSSQQISYFTTMAHFKKKYCSS